MHEEELEELVEPLEIPKKHPFLQDGAIIEDREKGMKYHIDETLSFPNWILPYTLYKGGIIDTTHGDEEASGGISGPALWIWEAEGADIDILSKEISILSQLDIPQFPKIFASFTYDSRLYLVTEALPEKTLAEALEKRELSLPQFLTLLSQVAYALRHLHEKGWAHLGIRPQVILLGKPIKLVDLRWAVRIGEVISSAFHHSGYSPPELLEKEAVVDERSDIFSVGALLYHFVSGKPIPEVGVQWTGWQCLYGGVPQILHRCLAPKEDRYPNMQVLHQEILRLKRRYEPAVIYSVVGATNIGLEPSRITNQDAYGYLEGAMQTEMENGKWLVACVADGMGGMEAGEVASEIAVRTVLQEASSTLSKECPQTAEGMNSLLKERVNKANERVCSAMTQKRSRGGTTLLCCLLVGKRLAIAHVGDCRLYLIRNEESSEPWKLLTRDHSLAMALALQEGQVDIRTLRHHPDRSKLTRSLGDRSPMPYYFVDSLEAIIGKPIIELNDGDILLLCSDGLWEPVTEEEMVMVLKKHCDNLAESVQQLLALALQKGAPDNVTVLLVQIKEMLSMESNSSLHDGGDADAEHFCPTSPAASESHDE